MRTQLWELVNGTPDFYKQAIALYPSLHTTYPFYQYERNIAWICFEVEKENMQSNPEDFLDPEDLPHSAAAFYTPIQDKSICEDMARRIQQARKDLNERK